MLNDKRLSTQIRWSLGLFLFLLIYDGALGKWVMPGAEQILFIAKVDLFINLSAEAERISCNAFEWSRQHPMDETLW